MNKFKLFVKFYEKCINDKLNASTKNCDYKPGNYESQFY